jgi:ATP-binding protein involved in chromosome partitioning
MVVRDRPDQSAVETALAAFQDPHLDAPITEAATLVLDEVDDGPDGARLTVTLCLPYPAEGVRATWEAALGERLRALPGVAEARVRLRWEIAAQQPQHDLPLLAGVSNVIAVASGKGGVGKSTTAVNLALALAAEGARVGLLDADIYGPSQGIMLGIEPGRRPEIRDEKFFVPMRAHGIEAMSMSMLTTDSTPMVWRGPMVSGALQQLIGQTAWSDLDYLLVDMPPGTGDIQLTLSQRVPLAGAVIVTTPQDIALLDAVRGIEMFRKVDVAVLGIVENMSVHVCSACGHVERLFGEGGGARVAERYGVPLLGALPLALEIREQADSGCPTVAADPDGAHARLYRDAARRLAARVAARGTGAPAPRISVVDD